MKRWLTVWSVCLIFLLSGCSFFNLTYDTLDYARDASSYLDKVTQFAADTPSLVKRAVDNQQAADDLKRELQQMKQVITKFNELDAPETVKEFHQQLIEQNNRLVSQIDLYLAQLKNGLLDPSFLKNNQLLQPVQEITNIIQQIKKLKNQVNETLNVSNGA
jgi:vacuolar-type H+-ATPase subunit I/STV1